MKNRILGFGYSKDYKDIDLFKESKVIERFPAIHNKLGLIKGLIELKVEEFDFAEDNIIPIHDKYVKDLNSLESGYYQGAYENKEYFKMLDELIRKFYIDLVNSDIETNLEIYSLSEDISLCVIKEREVSNRANKSFFKFVSGTLINELDLEDKGLGSKYTEFIFYNQLSIYLDKVIELESTVGIDYIRSIMSEDLYSIYNDIKDNTKAVIDKDTILCSGYKYYRSVNGYDIYCDSMFKRTKIIINENGYEGRLLPSIVKNLKVKEHVKR